mmetsp:Transcript_106395/g.266584  ORF Transcript_106395/g.266584 Transcript_106395/m.266584 type:complete len:296 (+) Transcript_106395:1320-2207(+)
MPALGAPHVPTLRGARRQDNGIVLRAQLGHGHVLADLTIVFELDAFVLQELQPPEHLPRLVELHRGDAVHEQAAAAVRALDDLDQVPSAVQLLSRREAGGAGADDAHALAGPHLRRMRLDPALGEPVLDDRKLRGLDGHWRLVDTKHTSLFARRRASGAGELWEVVGVEQTLQGPLEIAFVHKLVPSWDAIAQGAATTSLIGAVASRRTAIHASSGLCLNPTVPLLRLLRLRCVDLLPIHGSVLIRAVRHALTCILVESAFLVWLMNRIRPKIFQILRVILNGWLVIGYVFSGWG